MATVQQHNTFQSPLSRANQLRAQDLQARGAEQSIRQQEELQAGRLQTQGLQNQQLEAEVQRFGEVNNMRSMAQGAMEFLNIDPNDTQTQNQFLQQRAKDIAARGGDPQDTLSMFSLDPAQRREAAIRTVQIAQQMGAIDTQRGMNQPSAVREFQFFQGLNDADKETFMQIKRADPAAKIVDVAGAKHIFSPGQETLTPITSTEEEIAAAAEREGAITTAEAQARIEAARPEKEAKERKRKTAIRQAGNTVVQDLGRSLEILPQMNQGDGVVGANVRLAKSKIAGTAEANIQKFVDSALSNVGLDRLQQMRESSPTGGALGQVPIAQQLRLEKVLGSMDLGQPPEVIEANIKRVMNVYFDIMNGDAEERAFLVESGKMTKEESDRVDSLYFELPFDEVGRSIDEDLSNVSDEDLLDF